MGSKSVVITVATPATLSFNSWAASYGFSNFSPTATPENDGIPNLLKYLCDIDPRFPMTPAEISSLPVVGLDTTSSPGTTYLTLTYRQYSLVTGITILVQTSADLKTWTTVTPDSDSPIGIDALTGDPIIEVKVNTKNSPREFIRLAVSSP